MADTPNSSKTMSSRLLTMKFMQRGSPSTSTPSTPSEPAYKRQRLSNGSSAASTPRSDAQRLGEVLATEERKRVEAVEQEGADRGETKWYLSVQQPPSSANSEPVLRVMSAGYSVLDAGVEEEGSAEDGEVDEGGNTTSLVQGRRNFGKFSRKPETQHPTSSPPPSDDEDSDDDEDDEDDEDDGNTTGVKAFIAQSRREAVDKARAGRQAKRKADESEGKRMADERRKKQVKLNDSRRISSGGGTPTGKGMGGRRGGGR